MKRSGNKGGGAGRGRSGKPAGRSGARSGGKSGSSSGKSGGRPTGRGFSSDRRRDGDSRDAGSGSGDRKPRFGDEKPAFRSRTEGGDKRFGGGEKRGYSSDRRKDGGDSREGGFDRKKFGDEKPPFRRSSGERPTGGSRFGGGEKRGYSSDRRREGGSREGGDSRKKFDGEKPPFRKTSGERPAGGRYFGGDKRRSSDRSEGGDRRESGSERPARSRDDRPFRKPAGDRPAGGSRFGGGEKRGYSSDRRREGGDRDRNRESGSERPRRSADDKPFRRPAGDRPVTGKRFDNGERRGYSADKREGGEGRDREESRKKFGDDKPFRKPRKEEGENTDPENNSAEKKPAFKSRSTDAPRKRVAKEEKTEFDNEVIFGKSDSEENEDGGSEFKPRERASHESDEIDSTRSFTESKPVKEGYKEKRSFDRDSKDSKESKDEQPWNRKEKHEFYGDKKKAKSTKTFSKSAIDDGSTRLNKYIANAGVCSRREADELIAAGVVSVNGEVVTEMGYQVMPGDVVKYNNESLKSERLVYILLNKPKDFITTTDDPENRKTVMGLIEKACKERVYPVGRLDRNTTGVLLFTNDGDLAKKLTHPSFEVHKVYQVELDRGVKVSDIEQIREGLRLEDGLIKADEVVYTNTDKDVVGIELHSGKNRIVRRIFEHLGYEVKKLDRVVFAGLTKKDLPRGRWRFLSEMEVASLKMMTGKKAAAR